MRESRQVLLDAFSHVLAVRGDVESVVAFVIRWSHRAIQAGGRMPKRRVDEPALSFASPDAPAIPDPSVSGLLMPPEVPNIPSFELNGLTIKGAQERDACVRTPFALHVPNLFDLGDEHRG